MRLLLHAESIILLCIDMQKILSPQFQAFIVNMILSGQSPVYSKMGLSSV